MAPSASTSLTRPESPPTTSQSTDKTEIAINIYDLLPVSPPSPSAPWPQKPLKPNTPAPPPQPSRLSTLLWALGTSLLHSGLVIARTHEYAYGGHSIPRKTGVYATPPLLTPPGATFRTTILQGFTCLPPDEIQDVIHQVSQEFLGTNYNLLTNNCNHFTSALCQRLTGKPAPGWLNRAAGIGLSLPCIVPREWIDPPDCETAEGALVDEEEEGGEAAEARPMLGRREGTPPARVVNVKDRDSSGREIPAAERAPLRGRK
ncbi:DUF862-domain-containing protein [Teratosphaeria destructans]|uniref:DUF862-domain-containing protein n=1 Tax=Teratosphaeria destructans TaxID=418781 RepID=A0A9W7W4A9_9PEZI|nr:DUF862-domain-containing protein [Teratosphaeria destructans]